MRVQLQVILVKVRVQLVRAQDLDNLHKLVIVVVAVEERLLPEDLQQHRGDGRAEAITNTASCTQTTNTIRSRTMPASMQPNDHMSSE